jgi:acetylornithine deacetylase/succinyl-diaminopimelate desuccinylase-like protein
MNTPASVVELLQELIRIPSVNPSGTPGTTETGELRCAEYLLEHLRGLGAQAELREVMPDRPNVVARFPSDRPGKRRLLFAPHTDTVSVAGMTIDPFGGELREGRLWGRGASDTKGSMASMLWALREKRDALATLSHEIWFAGLCGEEAGQQGAKALAEEERFDFVIAGEPTGLDIVHLHKGCSHLLLRAHGRAVHAARLELGENAIEKMMDALRWVRTELRPALAACKHPVLGHASVSPGTILGGSKINIVPDFCEAAIDIRTVPGAECAAVIAGIAAQLQQLVPGLEVSLPQAPPLDTPREHPLIARLESLGARCVGAPWFCDAAVFARHGVAAVAMGPGSIDQAHTKDEWIEVAELERAAAFFGRFLDGL